jgi:hypothetical protein
MAKPLKLLADQLWKNDGVILVSTFDDTIKIGSVVDASRWNNITFLGDAESKLSGDFPEVNGPNLCMLPTMNRQHELDVSAGTDLMNLKIPLKAEGKFKLVKDIVFKFDSPISYSIDSLQLEELIESQPTTFWSKPLGQAMERKNTRIVTQVFRSKFSFFFRGSGGQGVDLKTEGMADLFDASVAGGFKWRNSATIESKIELLVAVEYAFYDKKKGRLIHKLR